MTMELLSHYTDRAGFEGIAQSQALWATNFLHLKDTSEYFYAWGEINKEVMRLAMSQVPEDLKRPDFDLEVTAAKATEELRKFGQSNIGFGHLYVTSFACADDEDQNTRGIMTLWNEFTSHKGYCLQFYRSDVERILHAETMRANYEAVGLVKVKYGVNKASAEFCDLCFQMSQRYLRDIQRASGDGRLNLQVERWWAESALFRRLLEFCASHKDPCYKDQREVRIFAYPSPQAESRILSGLASRKRMYETLSGKKHIAIGEDWRPGFVPSRVIIGTKADRDITSILAGYETPPSIAYADLPVA